MKQCKVDTSKLWLSNKEAKAYLGVSEDWLDDRRAEGTLHYSKVGRTIFYMKCEVDDLIRKNAVSGVGLFQKTK